ncbi:hypothetical protein LCGC14_2572060 [marine sediment metagenome]|uniref:Uncharacterized protein n=1 Tax=marine sediment metagenome TaxID=412755 RepID=A0A0F9CT42_9ZZZZ
MISVDAARRAAKDLIATGDPHRSIVITSTPFKLGCLMVHLTTYVALMGDKKNYNEFMRTLDEIDSDVQKAARQILQQEFPPS